MKLIDLRRKLAELLSDRLGTFANGQLAIWVGESDMPRGLSSGIQCNIQPVPISNRNPHPVSGGMTYLDQSWRVTLVNFDRGKTMAAAIRGIQRLSPRNARYLPLTDKSFEQYSFELFDPGFVPREGVMSLNPSPTGSALGTLASSTFAAGLNLSALRAIVLESNQWVYASDSTVANASKSIALTLTSALAGVVIQPLLQGVVSDSNWNWDVDTPIYLGANGTLTQNTPTASVLRVLALPVTQTQIFFNPEEGIIQ